MAIGDVKEGRGGVKYVQTGEDPKSKDSWKPFKAEAEKPSRVMAGLNFANNAAAMGLKMNPLMYAVSKAGEAVSPENAYESGGEVTDLATKLGASPEVAGGLGYATNVGIQAIPTILSGNVAKSASESILKPAGRFFMQSAVKPNAQMLSSGQAAKAVETMLKEGKNVTPGGISAMGKEVSQLSQQVDDIISQANQAGVTVSKVEAAKRVQDVLKRFSQQVDAKADIATIKKTLNSFLTHPDLKSLDDIPIELAQKMKSGTYSILGSKPYGELGGAEIEAQKALARGLKEEIEKAVPGVMAPNKRQGELLNALEVVAPRVAQAGNKNPTGLATLASDPIAAGAFMLDRSELIKSILGRFLYSGAPSIVGNSARVGTALGMGAAQP